MEQKKKSALTAALSGAPPDPLGQSDSVSHPKDDVAAFPCLTEESIESADAAIVGFEKLNLERRSSLAGSAPTASRLGGSVTASFTLNSVL